MDGQTILVIGANGAFGSEICQQLTAAGARVIGTASSAQSSIRLRADLAQRLLLDLESQASIDTLATYLNSSDEPIDGIVIASGLVAFGAIAETPIEVLNRLTQVNALGPISLVSKLISKLKQSTDSGKQPFVVSISGVIAETPMPGLAAYSSSKTALHGYSIAASKELKKMGIRWLDARPGHTDSGLAGRAIFGTAPNFGTGMQVSHVVSRIVQAIKSEEKDLPSTSF